MRHSRAAQAALLKWVNTFPLDPKVESLSELSDGLVVSKMLEDIDPTYSVKDFDQTSSPSTWPNKKKRLEAIYRSLIRYIRENCVDLDFIVLEDPADFSAIAEQSDDKQMEKLLTVFLMAAVKGASNTKYVGIITQRLDALSQAEIAKIIQQMDRPAHPTASVLETTKPTNQSAVTKDADLALEEERASHEALKKKHADFITRFERLQMLHDELLDRSDETDRQLQKLKDSADDGVADYINDLKAQLQEANDLIAQQENDAETDRITKGNYQRELASLRPSAEKLGELEDQLKELKTENQALSRKANTLDHFQRKLEMQSGIEKENSNLRRRIDTLEENQKDFDRVHEENTKLKHTIEEYQKRFNSYELQVVELGTQKKILENDLRRRQTDLDILRGTKQHDDEFIRDLQEQVRIGVTSPLPLNSPLDRPRTLTLEEELEQSNDPVPNHSLELSRLRTENRALKGNMGSAANATLRTDIEEWESKCKRLEENHRELMEKYAVGQEQLQAIISMSSGKKDEALINTRRLYLEANQELLITKVKLAEVQAELSSKDRELLAAKANLSAVNRDEVDALEELKATHKLISSSINDDLLLSQSKLKAVTTDYELQKSHLIDALLVKDRLQQQLAAAEEHSPPIPPTKDLSRDEQQEDETSRLADTTNAARRADQERIETQDATIQDLQRRLKAAEDGGAVAQKVPSRNSFNTLLPLSTSFKQDSDVPKTTATFQPYSARVCKISAEDPYARSTNTSSKAAHETVMKNLARENNMIATAWYDLSSRLQSNHVVLQRRQDAPKSWLGKQRQMVNATPRR